ncbi:MAG: HyaD/HybD family hydrogenase maturation endopeptidase [Gammaproteobacteria bacterium SHHR-1]|jgi:hydrogenase maturation protease|nr:HyaD/HybD family hydrogenase maturation endopeptidase [gamma proteobacterium SS-5]
MGNVLMQDEGIGVRAVEELECRFQIPPEVQVLDGGTTGMELFEPMRQCDCLIIADAINSPAAPGSLVRIANQEIRAFFQTKLSNHQLGLSDLLALLRLKGEAPNHIVIIGMVPKDLENRIGLSAEASAGLPAMVAMLRAELAELGVELAPRRQQGKGHWQRQADLELAACA